MWGVDALSQWLVVTPAFSNDVTGLLMWGASILAALATSVTFIVGLASLLRRGSTVRLRSWGGILLGLALAVTVVGVRLDNRIRMRGFRACAERLQTLVSAIKAYEARQGHPPVDLVSLFPGGVPETGLGAYPKIRYTVSTAADHSYGNSWMLSVDAFSGGWDQLIYLPNQEYPRLGFGGSLERLGAWAYVHE
jgi:hypothetical protein